MSKSRDPPPPTTTSSSSSRVSTAFAHSSPPPLSTGPTLALSPTIGRKVYINKEKGFDVARAFRSMEIMVARNGVRRDFNKQRFHERGGTKRKRLKGERWRRNFKEGFRAVVRRVLRMRRQGW
jgi:small subunit ribosomal protein MRP21